MAFQLIGSHGHIISWVKKCPSWKWSALKSWLLGVRLLLTRTASRLGVSKWPLAGRLLLMGNGEWQSSSLSYTLFMCLPGNLAENSTVLLLCFIGMSLILQHLVCSSLCSVCIVWDYSFNLLNHDPSRWKTVRTQLELLKLLKKKKPQL